MITLNKRRVFMQVLPDEFVVGSIVHLMEVLEDASYDEEINKGCDLMIFESGPKLHHLTYRQFFDALTPETEIHKCPDIPGTYKVILAYPLILQPVVE